MVPVTVASVLKEAPGRQKHLFEGKFCGQSDGEDDSKNNCEGKGEGGSKISMMLMCLIVTIRDTSKTIQFFLFFV